MAETAADNVSAFSDNISGLDMTTSVLNITTVSNISGTNETKIWGPVYHSLEHLIVTSIILGLMILATIIGNCFVIAAVLLEKNLHNVANYLILSLAVADLMVASLVMPISAITEMSQVWFLSAEICDMWISFDVLCCTASILHLVAIAIDRYWAVTNIDYVRTRSAKRILTMVALVWAIALCISIPPLFGWKDSDNDPTRTGKCIISQDHGYTIFSTLGAFYLPLFIMLAIYARIYQVARSRIRKKGFHKVNNNKPKKTIECSSISKTDFVTNKNTTITNGNTTVCNGSNPQEPKADSSELKHDTDDSKTEMLPYNKNLKHREKIEMKRERKAARTLAIITGVFILCWVPFFIIALIAPFYRDDINIPPLVGSIVLWLGYVNSLLNPIIYTIFSPDFRNAFRKILFGKYRKNAKRWK